MRGRARRAALVVGYACIVLGWVMAFSWPGLLAFVLGAVLVTGAAVGGAIATRSVRNLFIPLAGAVVLFVAFPLVVNLAVWVGRGFQGPDEGSAKLQTPAPPRR